MKPKVNDNKGRTIEVRGAHKTIAAVLALRRTQGVDIRHRGSTIRRLRETEGRDCGEIARAV